MKHLITYGDGEVLSVTPEPTEGIMACGTKMLIDTLKNAKIMLDSCGVVTTKIDEYVESHPEELTDDGE